MIRQANMDDLKDILIIIKQAQQRMKRLGLNQWQNNYPNESIIVKDIEGGHVYVYEDTHILATMSVFDHDPVYDKIIGKWLNDNKYCVIHRIAVSDEAVGLNITDKLYKFVLEHFKVKDIRIDTHEENSAMIKSLKRNQFIYVGIVHVLTDPYSKRLAFHLSV